MQERLQRGEILLPKKNVKSVVISVLVTRRCSFGLQMKEVQSFTSVSTVEIKHPPTTSVFFPYSRFGQRARLARLARLSRNDLQVSRL
ncbi:hypothetical protein AYX14_06996 [Cryptococcus neoformans]|nr:hypothetical protein AYX14_06996 [Cryptococcus neoformans var. grubii]